MIKILCSPNNYNTHQFYLGVGLVRGCSFPIYTDSHLIMVKIILTTGQLQKPKDLLGFGSPLLPVSTMGAVKKGKICKVLTGEESISLTCLPALSVSRYRPVVSFERRLK